MAGPGVERFQWRPEYVIGDPVIDRGRQHMVDLANALYEAVVRGKAYAVIDRTFQTILLFTKDHFAQEERYLLKIGSMRYDVQVADHRSLEAEAHQLWSMRETKDTHALGEDVQIWIEERLLPHVIIEDRAAAKNRRA